MKALRLSEHRIKNITLENINLTAENAIELYDAENIKMNNVNIEAIENGGTLK